MKITAYLYWSVDAHAKSGGEHIVTSHDNFEEIWPDKYTMLGSTEAEFADVVQVDPRERAIHSIDVEIEQVSSEASDRLFRLKENRQQLLALPNNSEIV